MEPTGEMEARQRKDAIRDSMQSRNLKGEEYVNQEH
jgi:hypothetical protein